MYPRNTSVRLYLLATKMVVMFLNSETLPPSFKIWLLTQTRSKGVEELQSRVKSSLRVKSPRAHCSFCFCKHGFRYQLYTDDTQIYITFHISRPNDADREAAKNAQIEACVAEIRAWMVMHRLKLNDDKTEFVYLVSLNIPNLSTSSP